MGQIYVNILAYLDPVQLESLWCFCAKVSVLLFLRSKLKGSHLGFLDWQIKRGRGRVFEVTTGSSVGLHCFQL